MEEERLREQRTAEGLRQRRMEYQEKLEAGRYAKRVVEERKKKESQDVRQMRSIEKKHRIARSNLQKRAHREAQEKKDREYAKLMKQYQELEANFRAMKHKENHLAI